MNNISKDCPICLIPLDHSLTVMPSLISGVFGREVDKNAVVRLSCDHEFHLRCIEGWAKINLRCPLGRRLITNLPSSYDNLHRALLKSIKDNQIDDVRDILSAGFNPKQRSFLNRENPLNTALKLGHLEIAAELIRVGATTNNKIAQNKLGWMYHNGFGVEQDNVKALNWYRKAADQGHAIAQNNLGWMYQKGLGVEQNYAEALNWYRKAANQGNTDAQNSLAWMYKNGLGVEQSYAEARAWYIKDADQGCTEAQESLDWKPQIGLIL